MCSVFFNDTATTEIYTLSLHDALPILPRRRLRGDGARRHHGVVARPGGAAARGLLLHRLRVLDRKSTRLNSSHANISYAVFCLKKKNPSERLIPTSTSTSCFIYRYHRT